MKCAKCEADMFQAALASGAHGVNVWLTDLRKSIFDSEKRSSVSCYVCPACGYVELYADDPQRFKPE